MTLFDYLDTNIESIKFEVRIGIIPCEVLRHYQIYRCYKAYKTLSYGVCRAVVATAIDMNVQERWIFNLIKKMEREI